MDTAEEALAVLISVGVLTKEDILGTFPLHPARYHLAASGIEGILLNLSDSQAENWQSFEFGRLGKHVEDALLIHCWYIGTAASPTLKHGTTEGNYFQSDHLIAKTMLGDSYSD